MRNAVEPKKFYDITHISMFLEEMEQKGSLYEELRDRLTGQGCLIQIESQDMLAYPEIYPLWCYAIENAPLPDSFYLHVWW